MGSLHDGFVGRSDHELGRFAPRHEIDPVRRSTQLNHVASLEEVTGSNPNAAETECVQDVFDAPGVLLGNCHEKVDVSREPRVAVKRDRVTSHQEILNPCGVE